MVRLRAPWKSHLRKGPYLVPPTSISKSHCSVFEWQPVGQLPMFSFSGEACTPEFCRQTGACTKVGYDAVAKAPPLTPTRQLAYSCGICGLARTAPSGRRRLPLLPSTASGCACVGAELGFCVYLRKRKKTLVPTRIYEHHCQSAATRQHGENMYNYRA